MNDKKIIVPIIVSALTSLIISGICVALFVVHERKTAVSNLSASSQTTETQTGDSAVVEAVKKANPAVVSIIISEDEPVGNNDPFDDFFGNFFNQNNNSNNSQDNGATQEEEVGGGSGFFVSANGLIVTNDHVVSDKNAQYTVYTNDGKKHTATVVAGDSVEDIAVIKIDGGPYPYLNFDESNNLNLGQTVIAIGNALGEFRNTVSVGVVSGLSRSITAGDETGQSEELDQVIQTDAAINPGNSGGPLLDLAGNVVGVNVAVAEGSQSIGFALPADSVKSAVNSVEAHGTIVRPYLGIRYIPITDEIKQEDNLSVDYGVLVVRGETPDQLAVIPGSPADKAGIQENDIILDIDGTKLTADQSLSSLILKKNVGDTIKLTILRHGQQKTVSVKLEAYSEQ